MITGESTAEADNRPVPVRRPVRDSVVRLDRQCAAHDDNSRALHSAHDAWYRVRRADAKQLPYLDSPHLDPVVRNLLRCGARPDADSGKFKHGGCPVNHFKCLADDGPDALIIGESRARALAEPETAQRQIGKVPPLKPLDRESRYLCYSGEVFR